MIFLSQVTI